MKKRIRLTESDLVKLVNRIIKEQSEKVVDYADFSKIVNELKSYYKPTTVDNNSITYGTYGIRGIKPKGFDFHYRLIINKDGNVKFGSDDQFTADQFYKAVEPYNGQLRESQFDFEWTHYGADDFTYRVSNFLSSINTED
jgi:hypothetical protein